MPGVNIHTCKAKQRVFRKPGLVVVFVFWVNTGVVKQWVVFGMLPRRGLPREVVEAEQALRTDVGSM